MSWWLIKINVIKLQKQVFLVFCIHNATILIKHSTKWLCRLIWGKYLYNYIHNVSIREIVYKVICSLIWGKYLCNWLIGKINTFSWNTTFIWKIISWGMVIGIWQMFCWKWIQWDCLFKENNWNVFEVIKSEVSIWKLEYYKVCTSTISLVISQYLMASW